jgi:hypothetical protein
LPSVLPGWWCDRSAGIMMWMVRPAISRKVCTSAAAC